MPYYTMGDAAGSTTASNSSGNPQVPPLTQVGSGTAVVFGNATGPGTDGLTAATFTSQGKNLAFTNAEALAGITTTATIECFINTTHNAFSGWSVALEDAPNSSGTPGIPSSLKVGTDGNQQALAQLRTPLVNIFVSGLGPATSDGATHHVAAKFSGTTLTLYVDGVSVGTASNASAALPTFQTVRAGFSSSSDPSQTLSAAHIAIFSTALDGTRILAHANAGLNGFAGETVASRLTRYASYAGIPATEVSFETGMVPDLAHIDTTGVTALEMMRKIEATEEGVLFDAADGTLTFHARNHRYSATPAFTLDVASRHIERGLSPRLDRAGIRNDVTATLTDGTASAHAFNQTSIDAYGPARESLDLATTNAEEPFQHANWLVGQYAEPRPRVSQLGVINLVSLPAALTQAVLSAGVGTRFRVTGMPSQAEKATQDYYIEGYSESIGPARHTITLNVSQAEPFDVWTVEDPVLGAYDSNPLAF